MTDLDNASAEIIEMRAISDLRAKCARPVPETIMPSERLLDGTDENASLVVHINSIKKSTGGGGGSSGCSGGENKSEQLQVRFAALRWCCRQPSASWTDDSLDHLVQSILGCMRGIWLG